MSLKLLITSPGDKDGLIETSECIGTMLLLRSGLRPTRSLRSISITIVIKIYSYTKVSTMHSGTSPP